VRLALIALAAGLVLAGCKTEVTEADSQRMREEFSQENYERNMKAMGKGAELEAEKARQQQHAGGQNPDGS
jgi:Pyruvate/2-oxoacid:ferredoxin oxidoreductase gamma subunit